MDLEASWRSVAAPVLVVIGEHDWVVGEDDQRALGREVTRLDGLDHAFGRHASRQDSVLDYGQGDYDPRVAERVAAWLLR